MAEDTTDAQKRVVGKPFVSGDPRANPGGRPRMSELSRGLLADAEPAAIKVFIDALNATKTAVFEGTIYASSEPDHPVRIAAATALLERRLGKAPQAHTGEDGGPILVDLGMVEMLRKLAAP